MIIQMGLLKKFMPKKIFRNVSKFKKNIEKAF